MSYCNFVGFHYCKICGVQVINPRMRPKPQPMILRYERSPGGGTITATDSPTSESTLLYEREQREFLYEQRPNRISYMSAHLKRLQYYIYDNLRGIGVYAHLNDENKPFFYCQTCGPRINAIFFADGFTTLPEQNTMAAAAAAAVTPSTPLLSANNASPVGSPPRMRDFNIPDQNPQTEIVSPTKQWDHYQSTRRKLNYLEQETETLQTTLRQPCPFKETTRALIHLINDIQEADFDRQFQKNNPNNVFHQLLQILSPEYIGIIEAAKQEDQSLRKKFGADQGPLAGMGLCTYPRLTLIAEQVRISIQWISNDLKTVYNKELYQVSPLVWSMQHITARGIELSMMDVDHSWHSTFIPSQRTRMILALILLLMLIIVILALTVNPRHDSNMPASSTMMSTTYRTTPTTTTLTTRTTTTIPTTTTLTTRPTTTIPTTTTPTTTTPTTTTPTTTTPTTTTPTTTTLAPTVNCDLPTDCEGATHWQNFYNIVNYNYNLPTPIQTIGDMLNACGDVAKNAIQGIWQNCYPSDSTLFNLISNPQTDLLVLANYLAQK